MGIPHISRAAQRTALTGLVSLAFATTGLVTAGSVQAADASASTTPHVKRLCSQPTKHRLMACKALARTDIVQPHALTVNAVSPLAVPSGYGPSDLLSAYNLPANGGAGATIAIVDAQDDPNAESDLAAYRSQYGLPACTTANGCFSKIDQNGGTNYPTADAGWAGEISLDLDMVSAVAPNAHILLVESSTANMSDLGTAVNTAVAQGAKYVSNSYGGSEDSSDLTADNQYFKHPGVAITVSAGDSAYGAEYPAASQYVTSVGGTALKRDSSARGWSESVWHTSSTEGTGSGCSAYDPKPSWQTDSGCSKRAISDVSAVADPATGVAVYDSYQASGWNVYGGTSAAAPIIAGVYALAGTPGTGDYPSKYPYAHTSALNDVTTGSNGTCSPSYLCTAGSGYDGPTGLGTPNGTTAFATSGSTSGGSALTNGTFEAGTLSGWTSTGSATATTDAAHTGSYGALVGSSSPTNTSSIAQTFTAPTGSSKVSFAYDMTCPDTVAYDWATATLKDNTTGTTTTVLPKTCTNGAGWKTVSGSLTAGHSYTLTLTSKDDDYAGDETYTYYDDVTVS
ncbi:peptidase S8 [Streptomyces sp. NPDC006692]|uniref:S53 family peptidase n=1 Tax=unclassified Streptomyces TaxID=2593676 RepID=UPI0036A8CDEF